MRLWVAMVMAMALGAGAARGADWLIILNKSDGTASILDAKTGVARATVPVGKTPHEAEVLADGRTVAVSNYGTREDAGRTVTLVDLERRVPAGTIELPEGARPHGLKALSDGRLLVTAEGLKALLVVDPKARRVLSRIETARETSHMVVASPDGKRAYVANIGSGSVTAVDLAAGKVVRDVPTGDGAEGIAMTPDGRQVWVCNRAADTVSVLDTGTLEIAATLKVPQFPIRVKVTPDGMRALVSCSRSGDVAVIDTASRKEVQRIPIGGEAVAGSETRLFSDRFGKSPVPVGLLIAPDGRRAWVASTNADVVSAIDLASLSIVGRLTAGKEPDGLAGVFGR
jgi:YVTN family beta-propeller protein